MLVIQRPTVEAIDEEEANRQRFAISPLEPGFGHTLGNSLRRTLLSSIPGAAITEVRFDEALHEFDTLAGVTEDVTDIILNLKDVVLSSDSEDALTLRLDVRGPAEVTAGDIQTTSDVEILNPDLHIATLNAKARLAVDLTVDRGKGYLSALGRNSSTIGVIPIDAIFSPVRRVTFSVEPTRVEQSTAYDRLVLDIETDSSVSPRDALASAGATLKSLVELVEQMSDEPEGLALTEEHWDVIRFIREYYEEHGVQAPVRDMVKHFRQAWGAERGNSRYLHDIFPMGGPQKQGNRLAGIRKTKGEH